MPSLEENIRTARRSLEHSSMHAFVSEQVTAGKTEGTYQAWYEGIIADLRGTMKSLERMGSTTVLPSKEDDELTKLIGGLPQLIRDVRKFKKNLRDVRDLRDELKPYVIQLKELVLDRQIAAYETAVNQIDALRSSAEQANDAAQASAMKAQQAESTSEQLTQSNDEATKQIKRLLGSAERRKEKIEESKKQAEQELTVLKEVEIEADKSRRAIKAIESQLGDLAATTTDHVSRMRKTEDEIRLAVDINTKQKDEYLASLEKIKSQAQETLRASGAASLYGAYNARQIALEEKVRQTRNALYGTAGVAVTASFAVWWLSARYELNLTQQWAAKVGILSPFALIAWFLTSTYNRERILEEEYASKASMSISYPAFRDDLLSLTNEGDGPLKARAVIAAIEMSKEIFTDPLRVLKIGTESKPGDGKALEKASTPEKSSAPDENATEIAKKVGGVLQAATELIEKASKLTKVSE